MCSFYLLRLPPIAPRLQCGLRSLWGSLSNNPCVGIFLALVLPVCKGPLGSVLGESDRSPAAHVPCFYLSLVSILHYLHLHEKRSSGN